VGGVVDGGEGGELAFGTTKPDKLTYISITKFVTLQTNKLILEGKISQKKEGQDTLVPCIIYLYFSY